MPGDVRVGIDVGGTFTDVVLVAAGVLRHHKEPSTPDDPSRAVADGLAAIVAAAGLTPGDVTSITHGTTIGLNAIVQRRGARIALVVSEGCRDILEIGRARMPSSFDLHAAKEEPLVPRDRIVEIAARLGPDGMPRAVPDEAELDRVAEAVRATGAEAAALVVLHSYTDPSFEESVASSLRSRLPGVRLASSAAVWPEVREYERTLVAGLNAYIQPLMRGYFSRLAERFAGIGVTAPIFITGSNGGSLGLEAAADRPLETVLSGPASGVSAAARMGLDRIVTFDMGGTSSDIAVVSGGEPELATHTTIGGLPLILPVVAVSAIGAGGGSVVWVDEHGILKTGPHSTGADPGPVSYGRGGTDPAITDCYVQTGIIAPATFLGGRMPLNADAAEKALASLAERLAGEGASGAEATRVAVGALRVATAGMAVELRKTLAQRGLDPAEFTLVPYGGAGPTHAALLAEEVGIGRIVVPPTAAIFCALGAAGASLRRDFARSLRRRLDEESAARLREVLDGLARQAREWIAGHGADPGAVEMSLLADMRYAGQAYELRVPLADLTPDALARALHAEHERLYGFADESAPIELGTARLAVIGPAPELPAIRPDTGARSAEAPRERTVWLGDAPSTARVLIRDRLRPGDRYDGPAVIEQEDTTVLVPPGWAVRVDDAANLRLDRED